MMQHMKEESSLLGRHVNFGLRELPLEWCNEDFVLIGMGSEDDVFHRSTQLLQQVNAFPGHANIISLYVA